MAKLLGQESVSSEIAALFELVKNGYDSDAEQVTITFENFVEKNGENGRIIITDDGDGMTVKDLEEKWMVIGTASKERSPVSRTKHRNVTGNKGIGRFATEKLSEKTTLISKSYSTTEEFSLTVNWSDYEKRGVTFDQVNHDLQITSRSTGTKGTTIILENLRNKWTDEKINGLSAAISSLVLPERLKKIRDDKFTVEIIARDFNTETFSSIKSSLFDLAPYRIESTLGSNRMSGDVRIYREGKLVKVDSFDFSDRELNNGERWKPFGKCKVIIYFYPRASRYERWDDHYRKYGMKMKLLVETLNHFYGVKIYRDGFWVRPYGGEENDWLNLEKARVQANLRVGNSQVIGFVEISKDTNPGIIDTTTRERLVENVDFHSMQKYVQEIFQLMFNYRKKQNEEYKEKKGTIYHMESFESEIKRIKTDIKDLDMISREEKKPLLSSLGSISKIFKDFKYETEESVRKLEESERGYRNVAALGISTAAAAHELAHILPHLGVISKNIDHKLKKYLDAYKVVEEDFHRVIEKINTMMHFTQFVISFAENVAHDLDIKQKKETFEIEEEIQKTLKDLGGIFKHLDISFSLIMKPTGIKIKMNKSDFQSILLNFISNSIKALKKTARENENKIKITVSQNSEELKIRFSDSGSGVLEINRSKIFQMFFTTYRRSTGIGLSIIQEILQGYSGKIELWHQSEIENGATFDISIPMEKIR